MVQDETEDAIDDARPKVRYLLFAGVAGACLLGAGLGLWARPALSERGVPKAEESAEEVPVGSRKLQIVFDDAPAPIGKPLEVMGPRPAAAAAPPSAVMAALPARPPAGLTRVDAPAPVAVVLPPRAAILPERRAPLAPKTVAAAAEPPTAVASPAVHAPAIHLTALLASAEAVLVRIAHARPTPAPAEAVAAADEAPEDPPPAVRPAHRSKAVARHADAVKLAAETKAAESARAERQAALEARRAERIAAAKAKAEKLARAERARKEHRAELAEANAEARAQARREARAEALAEARAQAAAEAHRKSRLAALAHAIAKIAPHHSRAQPKLADQPPPKPQARPPIHGSGPIRLASATRCVSADPGEALACADPQLVAAERRMNRAYQQAEAAGVPPAELKRQQQKWLAARAAAAREAPWAVRDVYQARIAELEDMAHSNPQN